ncbi:Na+/H+ antiporter NhaC family protein [Bacteroides salyersiae]|uniref:Na+/H+ antiporter NhaC family protein n=1 Tax=Bacteroides salyersiae TaxID=291644 RepID=UPI001897CAFF|nr:Na+/H+ antiporter NhaC family protein [Bacteroides salyersiae]
MKFLKHSGKPSWTISLVPFVVLVAVLTLVIHFFGADALSGGSQVSLMFASAVVIIISMARYKVPWKILEDAILDNIRAVGSAILILFLIGAIAGTWMISGVVPTLIYYGMKVITPGLFLFAACLISALVAVMTGSSWTTIATIGVALVGIGTALGFSSGWTAGAIISGAYFGDKISPLSDTTILASSSSGTPLFTHIKYMLVTTVPSFVITVIVFLVVSLLHDTADAVQTGEFSEALQSKFRITPILFLVPLVTVYMIARKLPAILTLFVASCLAAVAALIFQPQIVTEVANGTGINLGELTFTDGFKGIMITFYGSTNVLTGNEILDSLIATRGMTGMLNTVFLIIMAVTFGGVLTGSGMLQSLTDLLIRFVKRTFSLVGATVGTGIFCNMATGDQYLSVILTSSMYKKLYEKKGYENRLLSRSVEDSATVVSVLIPWNSCGMTQSTVLKVPTMDYLPYCLFNILSPLMSLAIAAIGYKIVKKKPNKKEVE